MQLRRIVSLGQRTRIGHRQLLWSIKISDKRGYILPVNVPHVNRYSSLNLPYMYSGNQTDYTLRILMGRKGLQTSYSMQNTKSPLKNNVKLF